MKARWAYRCLWIAACISLGWQFALFQMPTDLLVGSGIFLDEGYVLKEIAPIGSKWAENGSSIYRAILRVDTRNVTDWLNFFDASGANWQVGTPHQYLVERRDDGGKRVITITLERAALAGLLPYAWLAFLGAISYTVLGILLMRQKNISLFILPLLWTACAVWLDMAWLNFGVPFSYIALQTPFVLQMALHGLAQTLLLGAIVHIAIVFPNALWTAQRHWLLIGLYALYPFIGGVIVLLQTTPAEKLAFLFQWEQQITVALKALAYLIWAVQYRRANVRQRGQLHWVLAGITAYDLVYLVRIFSPNSHLLTLQLILSAVLPVCYLLALLPKRAWRLTFEGTSGFVHGIANTLTLALFLCGIGLAASALLNKDQLPVMTLLLSIGFSLTTVPLANLLREQFDSWFHGTRSAQRALLHEFTGRVSAQITLSEVVKAFDDALEQGVQPAEKILWLWNDEAQALQRWGEAASFLALQNELYDRLIALNGFTLVRQFPEWESVQLYYGFMPLVVSRQLIGVCAIGQRMDGRNYSVEGLRFLETLARPATLALRNAQLVGLLEDKIIALRQAYQQLIAAQEHERSRLATELHDETLQQLAHVNLLAGGLQRHIPEQATPRLKELQGVLTATERGLREILRGVHPAVLTDLGLIPALRSWLPQSDSVKIQLMTTGFDQRLPDAMLELTLYRLCQESINNALKHAHASKIEIHLIWQAEIIMLEIKDDGIGFEPATLAAKYRAEHGHFGLTNLRERVNALNGQLQIQSQPHEGTTIRAILPLRASPSRPI